MKRYYLQLMQLSYADAESASGVAIPLDTADPRIKGVFDGLRQRVRAIVQAAREDAKQGSAQDRAAAIAVQETEYIYSLGLRMAYEQIGVEVEA